MWNKIKPYVISVAIALTVGGLSAFLTRGTMNIYEQITKPPAAPPGFLFPIVWTILYILMGISAGIIYKEKGWSSLEVQNALSVYACSLVINFSWSIIFFKFRAFALAFAWLILLQATLIRTIILYRRIKPLAAYLQLPYALWVAFAGYLNLAIVILN